MGRGAGKLGSVGMWVTMAATMAAGAAGLPGWQRPEAEMERQLEAGIHREVVLGDLAGAILEYRAILDRTGAPKAVAAQALFHLAACQEKLGRRAEALTAYRRVAAEYRGAELAAAAEAKLADIDDAAPGPRNLKFEEGEEGKAPPGWFVPALPRDAAYVAELRRSGCRNPGGCAVVKAPPIAPVLIGYLMQSFSAAPYRGRTVRLRAWLKLEPRSAGDLVNSLLRMEAPPSEDSAQMWLSVDRENHRGGFFDNMDDRPVRSAEWARYEISGAIDQDARFIEIGVMSIGRGHAWVDDVSFEVVK